jgi:hypothetical protein
MSNGVKREGCKGHTVKYNPSPSRDMAEAEKILLE